MSLLHEAVEEKKFDVRMIERNLIRGKIEADDVAKTAKKLPDDAENAEYIAIESLMDGEGER